MKTHTHPCDYSRPVVILNEYVKVCIHDGGRIVSLPPDGVVGCLDCRRTGNEWVLILESECQAYRDSLKKGGVEQ